MHNKKAMSVILGTTILILISLIAVVIIYTWSIALIPKPILLSEVPIETFCPDINFEVGLFGFDLELINRGNVDINGFKIIVSSPGTSTPYEVISPLAKGESATIDLQGKVSFQSGDELNVIPILIGKIESGEPKQFACPENFGWPIIVD
jgi:hypothetical protein